jgi:hypothetical protein
MPAWGTPVESGVYQVSVDVFWMKTATELIGGISFRYDDLLDYDYQGTAHFYPDVVMGGGVQLS